MIKNIRLRLVIDPRGKLTSGKKSDKGFPQSLDYFNVENFPELQKAYGNKPAEFFIYVPSDNITDIFDCEFNVYGAKNGTGTKKRSCDGETCIHRITEIIGSATYGAGEASPCVCAQLPPDDKQRCKYVAYFRCWIALPQTGKIENPMCYLFQTHSQNSGDAIYSELDKIKILNHGILRGVPFKISVKMIGGKTDAKMKFPIWTLQAIGMISEIRNRSRQLTGEIELPKSKLLEGIPEIFLKKPESTEDGI